MSVKGACRTRCSGTKRYMCTNIRMKLIMTRGWSPLRIIENESILAHVGGASHSKWDWFRPTEYFLAFAGWSHWGWDHLIPLGLVVATQNETDWDQLSPSLATAKYGHSKWVHFSPFETHRDQMSPQVAHWAPFRFHSEVYEVTELC